MIDYNDSTTWYDADIHNAPLGVDVESYQNRINSICGLSPFGTPNIKLVWCPSMENYSKWYCEWDKGGFGTKYWLRGLYVFDPLQDDAGNPIDVPPARWALKQFLHPVQYLAADEDIRWKTIKLGKHQTFTKEMRPPRPQNGYYVPLAHGIIRKHDGSCCLSAKAEKSYCWGQYRQPDEHYLTLLKKAVKERDSENVQNPNEPISARAMEAARIEAGKEIERQRSRAEEFTGNFVDENLPDLLAHFTGDKSFLEQTKGFSFAKNSGLILPKQLC